jgi:hypothetical protein
MALPAFGRRAVLTAAAALGLGFAGSASVVAQGTPTAMMPCATALAIGNEGDACVNVVHASADAPAVDVYGDGAVAIENLTFGSAFGFVALPAGDYNVQVAPTGTSAEEAVIDADLSREADLAYEVVALGPVAEITAGVFPVDVSAVGSDESSVRVVHASPDAGAVDVALQGGDVLVENLEFPNASDDLLLPESVYDLEVRSTATEEVALDPTGTEVPAGATVSFDAIDSAAEGTLAVLGVGASVTPDGAATPEA